MIAEPRDYCLANEITNSLNGEYDNDIVLTWLLEVDDVDIHDEDVEYLAKRFLDSKSQQEKMT